MIRCDRNLKRYCSEPLETIENYEQAVADKEHLWDCHHRNEICEANRSRSDRGITTRAQLIADGMYYHRPACELIFLRQDVHRSLHLKGRKMCQDTRRKLSEALKGKTHSCDSETRRKISEAHPAKITVEMTRMSDGFTMRFHSQGEAARYLRENGFPRAAQCNISNCCRGIRASIYGAKWRNVDV